MYLDEKCEIVRLDLNIHAWRLDDRDCGDDFIIRNNKGLEISNASGDKKSIHYKQEICIDDATLTSLKIVTTGLIIKNGGGRY